MTTTHDTPTGSVGTGVGPRLPPVAQAADEHPHVVVGDTALLVVGWAVGSMRGTAVDVVRFDGVVWRYLIDNPHGAG